MLLLRHLIRQFIFYKLLLFHLIKRLMLQKNYVLIQHNILQQE